MIDQTTLANLPPELLASFGINPGNPVQNPLALAKISGAAQPDITGVVRGMESGGRDYDRNGQPLTSSAGAQYAMQTMPATQRDPGFGVAPVRDNSPEEANRVGTEYLAAMNKRYGNPAMALAAYNAGPGSVDQALKKGGDWLSHLPQETQSYVKNGVAKLGTQYADSGTVMNDASSVDEVTPEQARAKLKELGLDENGQPHIDTLSADQARQKLAELGLDENGQPLGPKINDSMNAQAPAISGIAQKVASGDLGQMSGNIQLAGQVAGGVNNYIGKELNENTPQFIKNAGHYVADSAVGRGVSSVAHAVGDAYKSVADDHPITAGDAEAFAKMAGLVYNAKAGADVLGSAGTAAIKAGSKVPILNDLAADTSGAAMMVGKTPPTSPNVYHGEIVKSYEKAKDTANTYYDAAAEHAAGKVAPGGDKLAAGLTGIIEDIKAQPFHEATSELPKLQNYLAKIRGKTDATKSSILDASGNPITKAAEGLSLQDVVDLKKMLNSNFNSKRFQGAADTAYGQLAAAVDSSLSRAATKYPTFGKSYNLAKKNWLNNVELPFGENNKVIGKFFKPEDYFGHKSVASGLAERLPDTTVARADSLVSNIKTKAQLDAVRRVLPADLAKSISKQVIRNTTKGAGASRLQSAGKAVTGAINLTPHGIADTVRNLADTVAGPRLTPQKLELIARAREAAPALTDYGNQFQAIQKESALANLTNPEKLKQRFDQ